MIGPDHEENLVYHDFGDRLALKLPLPKIYDHQKEMGFLLMADLGDGRLDRLINGGSPSLRRNLLLKVAKLLASWHSQSPYLLIDSPYFSYNQVYTSNFAKVYEWDYFLKGLALLGLTVDSRALARQGETLLANIPQSLWTFIHRDFQSRNLMLFNDQIYVLDWQGTREGPATYDLASFMYDPYTNLSEEERDFFLTAYEGAQGRYNLKESLNIIAPLRLAQAIGAYSHLANRGLPYGPYLLPALARLTMVLDLLPGEYQAIKTLVKKAQNKAKELFI
jgi:aminoglycoside/choline kinase family phosphotransferase